MVQFAGSPCRVLVIAQVVVSYWEWVFGYPLDFGRRGLKVVHRSFAYFSFFYLVVMLWRASAFPGEVPDFSAVKALSFFLLEVFLSGVDLFGS